MVELDDAFTLSALGLVLVLRQLPLIVLFVTIEDISKQKDMLTRAFSPSDPKFLIQKYNFHGRKVVANFGHRIA